MKTKIIKIGNSRGIMLSKHLIHQYEFETEAEIIPKRDGILIRPSANFPRAGWEEQFEEAIKKGQQPEKEILEGFSNEFDNKEWTW
jgi:antitoxin MazE